MTQISTIRPGLFVALKSEMKGNNVTYTQDTIEPEHEEEDGAMVTVTQTEKAIKDKAEHEAAIKTRSKCRNLILRHCARTGFGLLCPLERKDALLAGINESTAMAAAFNATSKISKIWVGAWIGEIASDDSRAVRMMNNEVTELLERMEQGVAKLDVQAIREAAGRLKSVGSMLSAGSSEKVQEAIKAARAVASKIVKASETGAAEIDNAVLTQLRAARTAFLDLDEAGEIETPVAAAASTARALDLEPEALEPSEAAEAGDAILTEATARIGGKVRTLDLRLEPEGQDDNATPVMWMIESGELWALWESATFPTQEEAVRVLRDASGENVADDALVSITSQTKVVPALKGTKALKRAGVELGD